ncbi:FadR/GntR family transcriptional regulator [Chryseomicrobium palamuruense]|uniref:FadR/GntR family transcriptional regulator n=1 Tax=Chryseomicrobium palamuruense TaxID=682973 RepID=A0ABV8UXS5_9BACL
MGEPTPKYKRVIETVIQEYLQGSFAIGHKLPPERELAQKLGVSRTGLREALRYLADLGAIQSRQGGGHYLRVSRIEDALGNRGTLKLEVDPISTAEMLEVRRALECEAAFLAASQATSSQLAELKVYLSDMKRATTEEEGAKADIGFHFTLVRASHNPLLIQAVDGLVQQMEHNIQTTRRRRFHSDASRYQATYEEHEAIYLAICEHRAEESKHLMLKHLNRAYQEIWGEGNK